MSLDVNKKLSGYEQQVMKMVVQSKVNNIESNTFTNFIGFVECKEQLMTL